MAIVREEEKSPQVPASIAGVFKRGVRSLIADNSATRSRIQLLLEAISVAHEFTKERQAERLGQVVTFVEGWSGDNSDLLTPEQQVSLKDAVLQMSSAMAGSLSSTMRASAIILAHSHLDNVLTRILLISITYDPAGWKAEIYRASQTRYTLQELDSIDPLKMMLDAARQYVARAKHFSITKRNEILLRRIGPFAVSAAAKRISKQSLKNFDESRHELIHVNALLRSDFDELAEKQCGDVLDHCQNLIQSLAEYGGLAWDELTGPFSDFTD